MKWEFLLLVSLFFSLSGMSYAQQSKLYGTITDAETNSPLLSVTVQVVGTTVGTTTNLDGYYELELAPGNYTIAYSYIGFETIEKQIELSSSDLQQDIQLGESPLMGKTVVVTDGKYEKVLEESTVSIDVINKEQLENNNLTSLDEIVQKAAGVQITDGQISIRGGAGYAYGVGSRVIFLVDGQPLLSAELSDVKWNFMPIENAEQIEIIKGSASVLYGSGALNGVVNLRTAYPKGDESYTAISMYAGIYDQPRVDSMRWYDPEDDAATMPMFAGLFFANRQRLHPNFDLVLGGNIHLKNSYFKDADERRFRFNFNTRYRVPNTDGRLSVGLNGNLMYHEEGRFFMAKDMAENAYENLSEIFRDRYLSLTLDPYVTLYDKKEGRHDLRGRWFRISKQQPGPNSDADLFSLEYQFQRTFHKGWRLTTGALGQYFNVNSILFADPDAHWSERALFTAITTAAYAQLDKKFFKRLSTTLGLRWEGFIVDGSFTPTLPILRLGLNYELGKADFLRASFGQGFRFPSMAERFFNERLPGTPLGIYPNPDLQPETGWTTELAYRHVFRGKNFQLYLDAALFWMEYDNMVEFSFGSTPQGPGFTFINVSQARIAGWEISTQGNLQFGKTPLRLWGGYTYSFPADLSAQNTELKDLGNFLGRTFSTFANGVQGQAELLDILKYRRLHTFRMDVETELKGFTIGTALNYNSFMQHIDALFTFDLISKGVANFRQIHNKGFWLWDLRLGYQITPKQRINLVIQNVLNEEYATRPAQMGAPRTYSLKYSHVF